MVKRLTAALLALALAMGLSLAAVSPASAEGESNHAITYVTPDTSEACSKDDQSPEPIYWDLSKATDKLPVGKVWTKVIIKAGNTGADGQGPENHGYYTDASYQYPAAYADLDWEHVSDLATKQFSHPSLKGISHVIYCYATPPAHIPADLAEATASAVPTSASCAASGGVSFSLTYATWDDSNDKTDGSRNATAMAGYTFANGSKTKVVTYTLEAILNPNAPPCYTPPAPRECTSTNTVGPSTNLNAGGWTEGGGEYVAGGYQFTLAGDWEDKKISRPINDTLRNVMANLSIKTAGSDQYVGLHFQTAMGEINFENDSSYGMSLWSTQVFPALHNTQQWYPSFSSVTEWVKAYADLPVTSVDLIATSEVASTRTITSVGFGCATYTFDYVHPVTTLPATPQSTIDAICGAATVHLSNVSAGDQYTHGSEYTALVYVDGVLKSTVLVPVGEEVQRDYTFAEDSGDHNIVVKVGETQIASKLVKSDCVIETALPVLPELTQPTCTMAGNNTVPEQPAGVLVTYSADHSKATFTPEEGYMFTGESQSITVDLTLTPPDCVITTVPKVVFTEECGIATDAFTFTPSGEHFTATTTDSRVNGVGSVSVVYTEEAGYSFPEETQTFFPHDFTNVPCITVPQKPEPQVSTRAVSTDTIDCATNTVSTVTEHYSTTTTYVYNAESNSYGAVKGDEIRGKDTSSSRDATLVECPVIIPGKPGPTVTNTSSTTVDCGTTIVTTRSSTTTVDYKLVNNVWVKQAPVTVQDPDTTRPATNAECGLTTLAQVTPVVTSVDRTCTVNGSYTLGMVDGVIYTVNGTVQQPGTYQVSTAKKVEVVASLTSTDFGFEQGVEAVRNLSFTDPKNCGELATLALPGSNGTLAFTGSNGTLAGGLLLGLMFVLFGAGVITVNRVNRRNS